MELLLKIMDYSSNATAYLLREWLLASKSTIEYYYYLTMCAISEYSWIYSFFHSDDHCMKNLQYNEKDEDLSIFIGVALTRHAM